MLGDNSAGPCDQITQPDVTVGPFTAPQMVRIYLQDSYAAPRSRSNRRHTAITGTKDDWQIQIGDGDLGTAPPSAVDHGHNLSTTLSIAAASS